MMRILIAFIVLINTFFMSSFVIAKSGPSIPISKISATEAINIAKSYFYNQENRAINTDHYKIADYILISVSYTNYFNGAYEKEWAWKIKFVHPIQNDHSVVYKVTNDKQLIFLYATE